MVAAVFKDMGDRAGRCVPAASIAVQGLVARCDQDRARPVVIARNSQMSSIAAARKQPYGARIRETHRDGR